MIDNTFYELIEFKITDALQNPADEEVKGYWCDGILLPTSEHEYAQKHVNHNRQITLTGFIGIDGQDEYNIRLLFG